MKSFTTVFLILGMFLCMGATSVMATPYERPQFDLCVVSMPNYVNVDVAAPTVTTEKEVAPIVQFAPIGFVAIVEVDLMRWSAILRAAPDSWQYGQSNKHAHPQSRTIIYKKVFPVTTNKPASIRQLICGAC